MPRLIFDLLFGTPYISATVYFASRHSLLRQLAQRAYRSTAPHLGVRGHNEVDPKWGRIILYHIPSMASFICVYIFIRTLHVALFFVC